MRVAATARLDLALSSRVDTWRGLVRGTLHISFDFHAKGEDHTADRICYADSAIFVILDLVLLRVKLSGAQEIVNLAVSARVELVKGRRTTSLYTSKNCPSI